MRTIGAVAAAVGVFYGASAGFGYYLGRQTSPDFSRSDNIQRVIDRFHSSQIVPGATPSAAPVVLLTLRGGDRVYRYRSDTDRVESEYVLPGQLSKDFQPSAQKDNNKEKVFLAGTVLVSTASGYVTKLADSLHGKAKGIGAAVAVSAVVIGAGVAWGYRYGHSEEVPFESPELRQALSDPERWRPFAKARLAALQPSPAPTAP